MRIFVSAVLVFGFFFCTAAGAEEIRPGNKLGGKRMQERAEQQQQEAEKPQPEPDAPATERRGDDLIVQSPGGAYTYPGFFSGMTENQQQSFVMSRPGEKACTYYVDDNAVIISKVCP